MAFALASGPALAQTAGKTVDVSAASADVTRVLQRIADQTGATIIVEQGVTGSVDVALRGVSLTSALTSVTKAAYLSWRKLLVPLGYTAADIRAAVRAVDSAGKVNILAAPNGGLPATAIFTGSVAEKASSLASELGLREVYYVFSPSTASSGAAAGSEAAAASSEEAASDTSDTSDQESASTVYQKAGASLSNLPPAEAYQVLQRLTNEVVAAMNPFERELAIGGPPIATEPYRYHLGAGVSTLRIGNFGGPTVYRNLWLPPW